MNVPLYSDATSGSSVRNGAATHGAPGFLVGGTEPEATRPLPKIASEPIAPTQRAKATRRRYSLEDKRRILRLVDAVTQRGQIGAILRREGIYYSTLRLFQEQREGGRLEQGATSVKKSKNELTAALASKVSQLERENKRLANQLEKAEIVIDFQKKLSRLLALDTPEQSS